MKRKEIVRVSDGAESVEPIGNVALRASADSSKVSKILASQGEMNVTSETGQSSEEKIVRRHMGGKPTKQPRPNAMNRSSDFKRVCGKGTAAAKSIAGKLANGQSTFIVTEQSSTEETGAGAAKLVKGRSTSIASSITELSSEARAIAVAVRSRVDIQASNQSAVDVCSELGRP